MTKEWEVEVAFKNMASYRIPYNDFSYTSRGSKPGQFTLTVPLTQETMDVLRGSEVSLIYKGEKAFTGKVVNKTPKENTREVILMGTDWNGILYGRDISFQGYDESVYNFDGSDDWDWDTSLPPGRNLEIEGSALIKLMLRNYFGEDSNDEFFNVDNMEGSITRKKWRFEGESIGESFSKVASMMQASTTRFGYNWWIDPYKRFWLKRYGDTIYRKALNAKWGPPSEDSSSVVNHIHLIGGIATPFPDDRIGLTDYETTFSLTATNDGTNNLKIPTGESRGWGCWISPDTDPLTGNDQSGTSTCKIEATTDKGYVSGKEGTAIVFTHDDNPVGTYTHKVCGIFYHIQNEFSPHKDLDSDWSDRHENSSKVNHQIRTMTFYLRLAADSNYQWNQFGSVKLKIYTKEPSFISSKYPPQNSNYFREEKDDVYDIDISKILLNYMIENSQSGSGDKSPWLRVLIVFDKAISVAVDADFNEVIGGGAGLGSSSGDYSSNVTFEATWDVFSGETPTPSTIWGFGIEGDFQPGDPAYGSWVAIDHLFFGFGEIEVERRDEMSIAMLDQEITRWIQDRKCHSWDRGEHLADVLLDSLKYAQKSRDGTLDYFNPELRLNMLIPVNEYGVEWLYVLDEIQVEVSSQGTTQRLSLGVTRPEPDDLMEFYQVQMSSMQAAGSGRTVHDWVANTKCYTRCELYCEFACLSDWSSTYKRGGRVCQTSRQVSCATCESTTELNPCSVACLKYSEIASIAQRPAEERSAIESTLLTMGPKVEAKYPKKAKTATCKVFKYEFVDDSKKCKHTAGLMVF
jgi:hypothetical protein